MDQRGASPQPTTVQEMSNILLASQGSDRVGKNWVPNFLRRTPELKYRFSRQYRYHQAKQEDPKVIREWFNIIERAISTYGILPEDIYNFDETGFAMGLIATASRHPSGIIRSDVGFTARKSRVGDRDWVN